ncbi:MAG: gamma carbonic anhydrase family protein [Pseudomonadota bacterium]
MTTFGDNVVLDQPALVDASAVIYGKAYVGPGASIWSNVFIRSVKLEIRIGARSNIQECVTIHAVSDKPTRIGKDTSITRNVTLQGCTIGDRCLIGNNATILDGAKIGNNSIVAGNAIVVEGSEFPANSVIAGAPARCVKTRNNAEANLIFSRFYHATGRNKARGIKKLNKDELKRIMSGR